MSITRYCLKNPSGVLVVVAIISVLGLYSLSSLPIKLFPDIERPWLGVNTSWRAAAPQEIESEIIEPLEDVLRGLPGLVQMRSTARPGNGNISMQFGLEADMQDMMIEVISRLNRLPPLPADANLPSVFKGDRGGGGNNTLAWFFIQVLPGSDKTISDYGDYVMNTIAPEIESVPGVAGVNYGFMDPGRKEIQINLDPYRAAEYGITITDITQQIGRANNISGGRTEVGRREYTLRYKGKYTPEQLADMILEWRNGTPIKLGDVAEVNVGLSPDRQIIYQNGNPAIGVQVMRESNANVFNTLTEVKKTVEQLRDGPLKQEGLTMAISFDPTVFIKRAIGLLINNLIIGLLLASLVLWWFLRHSRATLLITLTVPISLFTTFVVLELTGRSLNVISLAGLAFAVGMVMDAAIVVLENIIRLREKGKAADQASNIGTQQVWNALLASTITTVAIFIPVLFMKDVAGQLFSDLALTIAVGVSVSLIVAVTILPTMSRYWMKHLPPSQNNQTKLTRLTDKIMWLTNTKQRRNTWIIGLLSTPVLLTYLLMPKLDYLPPVKRDAVDAFFSLSPGASRSYVNDEIIQVIVKRLKPYMNGEKEPALKNYYVWSWGAGGTIGARVKDQSQVKALEKVINDEILANLPGVNSFARQGNLFGGFGNNGDIQLHLQSSNQAALLETARETIEIIKQALPNAHVNPPAIPGLAGPELQFTPKEERIIESGWSRADMGTIIRTIGEGTWLGEHFDGDRRLDMILRASSWDTPETLATLPLVTPRGHILPLSELVEIERQVGPTEIQRVDSRRTITLNIGPNEGVSLQEILQTLKNEVEPQLLARLPEGGSLKYGGSADDLNNAITSMSKNFIFALGLLCLLLAGLFRSIRDALIVTISIPLAIVGGIIALTLLNLITFQPLDLLTMIGFIILLGLVVNNAILLVHQTRQAENNGTPRREAVGEALKIRIRPILMSTLTSLFGMLPLLLFPGEGSAIYRGLAAAIVGGMTVSTLFTLILLPSLLQLGELKLPHSLRLDHYKTFLSDKIG